MGEIRQKQLGQKNAQTSKRVNNIYMYMYMYMYIYIYIHTYIGNLMNQKQDQSHWIGFLGKTMQWILSWGIIQQPTLHSGCENVAQKKMAFNMTQVKR